MTKNANILITTFAPITEYVLENCKILLIISRMRLNFYQNELIENGLNFPESVGFASML